MIIKARRVFDKTTLLSIYNSLILPYIGYCIHIWGNAYQTHLKKLHVLQNKIVGIIAGVPRRTSSDHLYFELNILKLKKLYFYAVGLCMYQYENDMLPELFKDMFIKVTDVHEHDTRNATTDQLYIPMFRKLGCTVYPKKYAHGYCFAVLCCGYTLTDFPISIRLS